MGWYDAMREAADAIEKLKNAEVNQAMATVRMEGAKLAEENARLREELLALREAARMRESVKYHDDAYWLKSVEGEEDGPFCQRCRDADQKLCRLNDKGESWWCGVCGKNTYKPGGRERERAARREPRLRDADIPWDR